MALCRQLLLFTGNYDAYKQLKMDVVGKCEYEKWVDKKDIDRVWEVREPMVQWGFGEQKNV